ncbi:MAG: hypothetical protein J7L08_03650 [Candidatus Aenigmarchaeota archaeon]|nr:hypothetical protein [Candidatus Aenigmarchaeota archaeon]
MFRSELPEDRIEFLNSIGLNAEVLEKRQKRRGFKREIVYESSELNPYKIKEECVNDFLEFCEGNIREKKKHKLRYTKDILQRELTEKDAKEIMKNIQPQTLNKNEEKIGIISDPEKTLEEKQELLRDLCLYDLILTMKSSGKMKKEIERYEHVIKRFRPELYDIPSEKRYKIKLSFNPKEIHRAAKACNTCLSGKENKIDHEEYARDPGTLVLVTKSKNGKYEGYVRNFLMKDEKMNIYLGMDTIEVIRESDFTMEKKDAEIHKDVLMMETLATVQLGLDIGVDYIIMNNSRAKFGPKQTFRNKKKTLLLRKLGEEVDWSFGYSGFPDRIDTSRSYILMENWKNGFSKL